MSQHEMVTVQGTVRDIFSHRFTVETEQGMVLADLTPEGLENVVPKTGDKVILTGEHKPSELKVKKIILNGVSVEVTDKDDDCEKKSHKDRNVDTLKQAVIEQGYELLGPYRNKPKHVEFLARRGEKTLELHVALDGDIYKTKSTDPDDDKWEQDS